MNFWIFIQLIIILKIHSSTHTHTRTHTGPHSNRAAMLWGEAHAASDNNELKIVCNRNEWRIVFCFQYSRGQRCVWATATNWINETLHTVRTIRWQHVRSNMFDAGCVGAEERKHSWGGLQLVDRRLGLSLEIKTKAVLLLLLRLRHNEN